MEQNYIWIKNGSIVHRIALDAIQFVSADGHSCKVHTSWISITVNCNLGKFLETLPNDLLMRIHRSYAINIRQVTGFSRNRILIRHIKLPVGNSFVKALQAKLFNSG